MTVNIDELQPASYRGIPFFVAPERGSDLSAGRRTQLHEYPRRDKPYAQDMGKASRIIRLAGFVVGADYITRSNMILGALEIEGPGKLIHPWLGEITVSVLEPANVRYDGQQRVVRFEVQFVESGDLEFPTLAWSQLYLFELSAQNVQADSESWFETAFRVAQEINRVAQRALAVYGKVMTFLANPVGALLGWTGLGSLAGNLQSIAAVFDSPAATSAQITRQYSTAAATKNGTYTNNAVATASQRTASAQQGATTSTTGAIAPTTAQARRAYDAALIPLIQGQLAMVADAALSTVATPATTHPADARIAANENAILGNVRQVLLSNCVGMAGYLQCAVLDDVVALRRELCDALDREVLRLDATRAALPATVTDPAQLAALETLKSTLMEARATVFRGLTERARNSARLITLNPPAILPAVVLAYNHYQDAGRAGEIVERNRIARPGFVMGPVRVLSQ